MQIPFQKNAIVFAASVAALSLTAQITVADCTRHIYNESNNVWSYGFTKTAEEKLGDNAIIVASGDTATIEYVTADTGPKFLRLEKVTYTDGKKHYRESFAVSGCYLQHDGRTGRAILNDPADGDVIFVD